MKIIALAIATSLLTGIFGIEKVEEEKVKIGTEIICEMSSEDIARIVVKEKITTVANNLAHIIHTTIVNKPVFQTDRYKCYWANFSLTESEYDLICTTVYCESGNQDFDTQVMVALTILNRLESDLFPDTVREVIYSKGAYSVTNWKNFESYDWTDSAEEAVGYALEHNEHPKNLFYFRTKHYHRFGKPYMKSDDLWFSTQE